LIPTLFQSGLNAHPSSGGGSVGGWVELGRTTLGSAGSSCNVSSLSDKRYYMFLTDAQNSGTISWHYRLGSGSVDSGSNYASRGSQNGFPDGTATSATEINSRMIGGSFDGFSVGYISNLSSKEKLLQWHTTEPSTTGAATAPNRGEGVGKWVNTSNPLDNFGLIELDSGSLDTGTEVVVLGWDAADTHTTNFWEELASVDVGVATDTIDSGTITAKKYIWFQAYGEGNTEMQFRLNSDSGSNYASRRNNNGGTDSTFTSQTQSKINATGGTASTTCFMNGFIINNASNEKLIITHQVVSDTDGAATAPIRSEGVTKWANTSVQATSLQIYDNGGTGQFGTNSKLRVWGSD